MTRPHRRIRKSVKWGGVVLCALCVAVWITGELRWFGWWNGGEGIRLTAGGVEVIWAPAWRDHWHGPGFFWKRSPPGRTDWAFSFWFLGSGTRGFMVFIPLWIPVLVTGLAGSFAWYLDRAADRRIRNGACPKCDYDRRGLALGAPCPECGAEKDAQAKA